MKDFIEKNGVAILETLGHGAGPMIAERMQELFGESRASQTVLIVLKNKVPSTHPVSKKTYEFIGKAAISLLEEKIIKSSTLVVEYKGMELQAA